MPTKYQDEFTLAGKPYIATIDLAAYMQMHELSATHPEMFRPEPGAPETLHIIMSPDNAAALLAIATDRPAVHWQKVIYECPPREVVSAWGVVLNLLEQARQDWGDDGESADRFRP